MCIRDSALRVLRKEIDRTCEVDLVEVFLCFDDQRGSFDLPGESDHFGMSPLAEYHDPVSYTHLPAVRVYGVRSMPA